MKLLVAALLSGVAWAAPAAAAPPSAPAAPAPIPLRDFFRNPEKAHFSVSPSGASIAFMQPHQRRMNVFVQPRGGGAPVRVTDETERDIAGYFWKGDQRIVYLKDWKGDENDHLVSVGIDGKGLRDLTPFPKVRAEMIDDLEDHATDILVGLNKRNPEIFDAYRLNVVTGALTLAAKNPAVKDKALLTSASPVFHVDKIRAPLFIVQGAKDPRVNIDESNQMVAALKKRGIDVPYLVKDDEGHGFNNEENRFELYEAMEKFLARHLAK